MELNELYLSKGKLITKMDIAKAMLADVNGKIIKIVNSQVQQPVNTPNSDKKPEEVK